MSCEHQAFDVSNRVIRLEDTAQFMLETEVRCKQCSAPFKFKGLWAGLNTNGAATSVDGLELRIAIEPS